MSEPTTNAHAVILAAGRGARLGADQPKPLVEIGPGITLLSALLGALTPSVGRERITLVLGHGADTIRAAHPDLSVVVNPRPTDTNTAKSLLIGLGSLPANAVGDVIWVNGDLFVEPADVRRFRESSHLGSRALVRRGVVTDEDVVYRTDEDGAIEAIGKTIRPAEGEAMGLNLVTARDRPALMDALTAADDSAYFEDAMHVCIRQGSARFMPVLAQGFCHEVDTPADLALVREHLARRDRPRTGGAT